MLDTLTESISKIDTPRNYWVGLNDAPRNNIELYTLRSWRAYHPTIDPRSVVGLEWWYHVGKTIIGVNPHFDCDEQKKMREHVIRVPLGCTINYLSDSPEAPTVITNVEPDWYPGEKFYRPTEVVYSPPTAGKTITFNPRYLHGIKAADLTNSRVTLMCNVWDYRPDGTFRVDLVEELADISFDTGHPVPPVEYLGETVPFNFSYFGGSATLPYPAGGARMTVSLTLPGCPLDL